MNTQANNGNTGTHFKTWSSSPLPSPLGGEGRVRLVAIFRAVKEHTLHRLAILGFDLTILILMSFLLIGSVLGVGGRIRLAQASVLLPMACMLAALVMKARTHFKSPSKRNAGFSSETRKVSEKPGGVAQATLTGFSRNLTQSQPKSQRCSRGGFEVGSEQNQGVWHNYVKHILRDWVPFLLIVFIYENLHDVAGQISDFDFAQILSRLDRAIFGVEPTLWVQRFYSPLATDIFSISYGLYFAFSLFIMFLLSLWDRRFEFRHVALAHTLVFIIGFIGYVFLPASPPRYFIEQLYTNPVKLHGLFLFDRLQGAWDGLSVISGGAFPSLHVGISTLALIYAFRFRRLNKMCRGILFAYIPLVVSLWFSTIYLRHHWVIDIWAGWLVAIVAYALADPMMRAWVQLRRRYGLPF